MTIDLPKGAVLTDIDPTMMNQALTNLIKNACEAIETLREKGAPDGHQAKVVVEAHADADSVTLSIRDNGTGLPADRTRLFEPYVTTRSKGTGLGLPIVKKIIEEHGGTLSLIDAPVMDDSGQIGAEAELRLPRLGKSDEK